MLGLSARPPRRSARSTSTGTAAASRAGCAASEIPLLGRILCLAQTVEIFFADGGADAAVRVARRRSGRWFDPQLVDALQDVRSDAGVLGLAGPTATSPPGSRRTACCSPTSARLDSIADAFARRRRREVALDLPPLDRTSVIALEPGAPRSAAEPGRAAGPAPRRAAARHRQARRLQPHPRQAGEPDRGGVRAVREHPLITRADPRARRPASRRSRRWPAPHHERLDGSGYPRGLTGEELTLPMRAARRRRRLRGAHVRAPVPPGADVRARGRGAARRGAGPARRRRLRGARAAARRPHGRAAGT